MTTPLFIGIVLTAIGLACGVGLMAWLRHHRRQTDRPYVRRQAVLLVMAVGIAFTLMSLLLGILIVVQDLMRR